MLHLKRELGSKIPTFTDTAAQFIGELKSLATQYWSRLFVPAALNNLECLLGPGGYLEEPARKRLRGRTPAPSTKLDSYPALIEKARLDPQAAVALLSALDLRAWEEAYQPDREDPFDATAPAINSLNTILSTLTTAYPDLAKR